MLPVEGGVLRGSSGVLRPRRRTFSSPSASGTIPPSRATSIFEPSTESVMSYMMHGLPEQRVLLRDARFRSGRTRRSPQRDEIGYRQRERDGLPPWSSIVQHACARAPSPRRSPRSSAVPQLWRIKWLITLATEAAKGGRHRTHRPNRRRRCGCGVPGGSAMPAIYNALTVEGTNPNG